MARDVIVVAVKLLHYEYAMRWCPTCLFSTLHVRVYCRIAAELDGRVFTRCLEHENA